MLIAILAFSFAIFGISGVRVVLGIVFITIPFYFILNNFQLSDSEKFVFSLLFGITIFPSLVYLLGFLISFKLSILIVFLIMITVGIFAKRIRHT